MLQRRLQNSVEIGNNETAANCPIYAELLIYWHHDGNGNGSCKKYNTHQQLESSPTALSHSCSSCTLWRHTVVTGVSGPFTTSQNSVNNRQPYFWRTNSLGTILKTDKIRRRRWRVIKGRHADRQNDDSELCMKDTARPCTWPLKHTTENNTTWPS